MKFPLISRRRHELEIEELRQTISKTCNTGCRTAKCLGKQDKLTTEDEYGYKHRGKTGHKVAHPGKRVLVTQHNGDQFVAKFKEKTGRFHLFYDHDRVKSSKIRQLSILTTDFEAKGNTHAS